MYVLKRHEDGKYVALPGSHHSYTTDLRRAQIFPTKEAAEKDKCGNESALTVESQLSR